MEKIANDPRFHLTHEELADIINPKRFIGMSEEQTVDFIENEVNPLLKKYHKKSLKVELKI